MKRIRTSLLSLALLLACAHAPGTKEARGEAPAAEPAVPPAAPRAPAPAAGPLRAERPADRPAAPAPPSRAGTASPGTSGPPGPGEYFPLSVGNEWVYLDDSPALPQARRGALRTVRILDRSADGFFQDNERGELKVEGACVRDRVRRLLCQPFQVGASWTSVVSITSTERYEIAATDEAVETPAGRFDCCVRVRAHNRASPTTDQVLEITYAPRVGPVRIETYVVVNGRATPQVKAYLNSYRLEAR